MHQGKEQGRQDDAKLFLIPDMHQVFDAGLNDSPCQKFLDESCENIDGCPLQGTTNKISLDVPSKKRHYQLGKEDDTTGNHSGKQSFPTVLLPAGKIGNQTNLLPRKASEKGNFQK